MSLTVIGVSHDTAPLEIRERFSFTPSEASRTLEALRRDAGVDEAVLLSTCNRTEIYVYSEGEGARRAGRKALQWKAGRDVEDPGSFLFQHRHYDAVAHLFRVVGGVDSMVVGEAEIQGQVRDAYELARRISVDPPMAGTVLHRLFQTALSVGGRIRDETTLGEGMASVASVAVDLTKKIFGQLQGRRVLILGAGETAELTVEALAREGVEGVVVANRTVERARSLANRLEGRAVSFKELAGALADADIVVSSTAAPHPILEVEDFRRAIPDGRRRPLLIVDLAVPRDVAPEVGDEANVFLYNVDDLRKIVDLNLEERKGAIPEAEAIIQEEVDAFRRWHAAREVVPVIRLFRNHARRVAASELARTLEALDHLPDEDREKLMEFSHRLLGKLLHEPTVKLREAAARGDGPEMIDAVRYLYDLSEEDAD